MTVSSSKDLKIYVVLIALLTVSTLFVGFKLGFFESKSASNYDSSPKIESVANSMQSEIGATNQAGNHNAYIMIKDGSIILSVNCKSVVKNLGEDGANNYIKDVLVSGKKSANDHGIKKVNVYVYDSSRRKVIMDGDINDLLKL